MTVKRGSRFSYELLRLSAKRSWHIDKILELFGEKRGSATRGLLISSERVFPKARIVFKQGFWDEPALLPRIDTAGGARIVFQLREDSTISFKIFGMNPTFWDDMPAIYFPSNFGMDPKFSPSSCFGTALECSRHLYILQDFGMAPKIEQRGQVLRGPAQILVVHFGCTFSSGLS